MLKQKALQAVTKAKPTLIKVWNHLKENPSDAILGVMAITMLGIDDSLDQIEELEEIQTIIDVNNYRG